MCEYALKHPNVCQWVNSAHVDVTPFTLVIFSSLFFAFCFFSSAAVWRFFSLSLVPPLQRYMSALWNANVQKVMLYWSFLPSAYVCPPHSLCLCVCLCSRQPCKWRGISLGMMLWCWWFILMRRCHPITVTEWSLACIFFPHRHGVRIKRRTQRCICCCCGVHSASYLHIYVHQTRALERDAVSAAY